MHSELSVPADLTAADTDKMVRSWWDKTIDYETIRVGRAYFEALEAVIAYWGDSADCWDLTATMKPGDPLFAEMERKGDELMELATVQIERCYQLRKEGKAYGGAR